MRVVLDTNVLVSGLLSPFKAPGEIVRMSSSGTLQLCYDVRILSEYSDVLRRSKFNLRADHVNALLDQIKTGGHHATGVPLKKALPDPSDEPFLEIAVAGKASCLITGNLKHYPHADCQGITVLSPSDFLLFYRKQLK
ncbi:MAG: putative toxin-antitoxin system toxin component, PIN family [Candidatus Omnitrophica bacterium]|nr:putative toxin-antitoxin system toxin component, PIN family [Candidatus Omnitrophota bacterium]